MTVRDGFDGADARDVVRLADDGNKSGSVLDGEASPVAPSNDHFYHLLAQVNRRGEKV